MDFRRNLAADGWLRLLTDPAFKLAPAGANVFVKSHHGHTPAMLPRLMKRWASPGLNISSIHRSDVSVASAYSTPDRPRGVDWRRTALSLHDKARRVSSDYDRCTWSLDFRISRSVELDRTRARHGFTHAIFATDPQIDALEAARM